MRGLAPAWRQAAGPGAPDWARRLPLYRCPACVRTWWAPYDPKDNTHYPAATPMVTELDAVLERGASLSTLFRLLDADAASDGALGVSQELLLRTTYDAVEALHGLIARLPRGSGPSVVDVLRLVHAALFGESGRMAFLLARDSGRRLPLDEAARDLLHLAMDAVVDDPRHARTDAPRLVAELRSRLAARPA